MSWSGYPVTTDDPFNSIALYRQLLDAWNERRQATFDWSTASIPAIGDDVQASELKISAPNGICAMQAWIEANCNLFVQSHNLDGTPRTSNYYDGRASIDTWNWANLKAAAGLNSAGWKTLNAGTFTYRRAAAGDDVITNHYNELRACFNLLIWSANGAYWDDGSMGIAPLDLWGGSSSAGPGQPDYVPANAVSRAIAAYAANGFPYIASSFTASTGLSRGTDAVYLATVSRTAGALIAICPTFANCAADFYFLPAPISGYAPWITFDGQGDPVSNGLWKLFSTVTGNTDTRISDYWGRSTIPADWYSPIPAYADWGNGVYRTFGYTSSQAYAICRWDVAGGFNFK